jgi:hypothetical protein
MLQVGWSIIFRHRMVQTGHPGERFLRKDRDSPEGRIAAKDEAA